MEIILFMFNVFYLSGVEKKGVFENNLLTNLTILMRSACILLYIMFKYDAKLRTEHSTIKENGSTSKKRYDT